MGDKKDLLKKMLDNIINDKSEEAQVNFHSYLSDKMKQDLHGETPSEASKNEDKD